MLRNLFSWRHWHMSGIIGIVVTSPLALLFTPAVFFVTVPLTAIVLAWLAGPGTYYCVHCHKRLKTGADTCHHCGLAQPAPEPEIPSWMLRHKVDEPAQDLARDTLAWYQAKARENGQAPSGPRLEWQAPPNWPAPPAGFIPPEGWQPDPAWEPAPEGWKFWRVVA